MAIGNAMSRAFSEYIIDPAPSAGRQVQTTP